jgi:hypothetical protein
MMSDVEMEKTNDQETIVARFATLMGVEVASDSSQNASGHIPLHQGQHISGTTKEFQECLSSAVSAHDCVCTLPSFELTSISDVPLPKVGESRTKVPQMAASVIARTGAEASAETLKIEQQAAQHLGNSISWTKSTLIYAPGALSKNISASFASLVDSRVRAWTLLLLRHSLTTGDNSSRSRLLSMLSSTIEVKSATTSFKTLPLPDSARSQPKEADVILPLLFEAMIHIIIEGKNDVVPIRAPGTIAGR